MAICSVVWKLLMVEGNLFWPAWNEAPHAGPKPVLIVQPDVSWPAFTEAHPPSKSHSCMCVCVLGITHVHGLQYEKKLHCWNRI